MKNLRLIILLFLIASCGKVLKTHVKGKVLNPVTGQGIENVRVILQKSGSGIPSGLKTVEAVYTDAGGNFDISARTLKGLTASVILDGNEYYSIGWQKDGEVYSILSPKKGKVTNADFHAVPYGNLQRHVKNISCFNTFDEIKLYYDGASKANYGYNIGLMTTLTGCIDITTNRLKMTSDYHYFHWVATKNGLTNTYYDTIFVNTSGVTNLDIFY